MNNSLILDFKSPCGMQTLTFEDDGKVAYAYLKQEGKIVGDVWLYNRGSTPDVPEWKDRNNLPFANPSTYVADGGVMLKPVEAKDVLVNWEEDSGRLEAYVYIFEDLYGVVGSGDKPGYARFASQNGPLAKIFEVE